MSGSSGGNIGGGDSYGLDCGAVNFRTQLRSLSEEMVERLDTGMQLSVEEQNGAVVTLHPESGEVVGSITYSKNVELIRCMAEGYDFVATIIEIDDGLVTVNVSAR